MNITILNRDSCKLHFKAKPSISFEKLKVACSHYFAIHVNNITFYVDNFEITDDSLTLEDLDIKNNQIIKML